MTGWLARRLLLAVATLVGALAVLAVVVQVAPGDPLAALQDDRPLDAEAVAALRARHGLDQPPLRRAAALLGGALQGDFGTSIRYGRPVRTLVAERLGPSLLLGGTALLLNALLGIAAGVWQARRAGRLGDRVVSAFTVLVVATPSFWLSLLLVWWLGVTWRWFPVAGLQAVDADRLGVLGRLTDVARHLALPALTLTLTTVGMTVRQQRAAMLEALAQPWVAAARARGLREATVAWRYAWPVAVLPVVQLLGLLLPALVTGAVFVEVVFAWPGLGQLAAQAAGARDQPLVLGTAAVSGVLVALGTFAADVATRLLDPRQATR